MNISDAPFQSEKVRDLVQALFETAADPAEKSGSSRNFHSMLVNLAEIFPAEKRAIFSVIGDNIVSSRSTAGPAVSKKSVFAGSKSADAPCETCPDEIKQEAKTPYLNSRLEPLATFRIPAELAIASKPEKEIVVPPPKDFTSLETLEELNAFLGVGQRDSKEIIQEIKSLLSAFQVDYSSNIRKLDTFVSLLFEQVIQGKHLEEKGIAGDNA